MELDGEVRIHLAQGRLTVGHAKVLLAVRTPEAQRLLAEELIRRAASVRDAEELVAAHLEGDSGPKRPGRRKGGRKAAELPVALKHLENKLQHRFSTRVILHHADKKGHIAIEYYGSDDLNRLMGVLGISSD
jgi:ParB family chromosome partitioning protein